MGDGWVPDRGEGGPFAALRSKQRALDEAVKHGVKRGERVIPPTAVNQIMVRAVGFEVAVIFREGIRDKEGRDLKFEP